MIILLFFGILISGAIFLVLSVCIIELCADIIVLFIKSFGVVYTIKSIKNDSGNICNELYVNDRFKCDINDSELHLKLLLYIDKIVIGKQVFEVLVDDKRKVFVKFENRQFEITDTPIHIDSLINKCIELFSPVFEKNMKQIKGIKDIANNGIIVP
jgi:hypothetical protein